MRAIYSEMSVFAPTCTLPMLEMLFFRWFVHLPNRWLGDVLALCVGVARYVRALPWCDMQRSFTTHGFERWASFSLPAKQGKKCTFFM